LIENAESSALKEGRKVFESAAVDADFFVPNEEPTEDGQQPAENDEGDETEEEESIVEKEATLKLLYPLAAKKILGKLTEDDKNDLLKYNLKQEDIDSQILKHIIHLLLKNTITTIEEETMKLLLSGVINLVDSSIFTVIKSILSPNYFNDLEEDSALDDISYGLDISTLQLLNKTIHDILIYQTRMPGLIQNNNNRKSDTYDVLSILNIA
jgi:hypothetical protein